MGWTFWRREQTEAERSLAALQEQAAASAPAAPPPAREVSVEDPRQAAAIEHMARVTRDLEATLATTTPSGERGTFMLEVTAIEVLADGSVALDGGAHEGAVLPGQVVGVLVLAVGLTHLDPELSEAEGEAQLAEALLSARSLTATVVSWDALGPRLVVSGIGPADVTVGSMVTR